jgi:general secretion pathway protein C
MAFDTSLRKHFWVVPLLLVAIAALLNAQAVSQLIGTGMELDPNDLARAAPGAARPPAPASVARSMSAEPILKRNPFDHTTGSLAQAPPSSGDGDDSNGVDTSDPWNAPTCDGISVTAIAASDDANWSFAAVFGSDKKGRLVRRGTEVDSKKVHFVGRDRVWLSSAEGLCQTKLFDEKKEDAPAAAAPAAATSASAAASRLARAGAKPLDADLRKGIQAVSPTEYNIDRGVVDKILENQAELMKQARIVPVQENGRVVGVRLLGVRQDALLGVLGMKNGDVLKTINGFEMGSPEKALEAYARLRTADKLTVQIERDGKTVNLDYNIR